MGYTELKPLAEAIARETRAGYRNVERVIPDWQQNDSQVVFQRDGRTVTVSLDTNSGSVCGVTFEVSTPELPHVVLRTEDDGDRFNKESEVNREVQTGDEAFDRAIYVDSDAPDAEILAMLQSPIVRDGARSIVGTTHQRITFFNSSMTASRACEGYARLFEPARAIELVDRMVAMAKAIPDIKPTGPKPNDPRSRFIGLYNLLALLSGVTFTIVSGVAYPLVDGWPHVALLGIGAILALCAQPLIRAVYKGRSDSSQVRIIVTVITLIATPLFVHGTVLLLNGGLDMGKATDREAEVVSNSYDSEDGNSHIELRSWRSEGGRLSFKVDGRWSGKKAKIRTRPGLIWEWRDGPVTAK